MSELARQIRELLEEEAELALEAGWAEVRESEGVVDVTLHLEPIKPTAAPLEVHFDSDELVMCYPGRNQMFVDFYSEDPEEIKRQVRALARAVVGGSYGERVKEGTLEVEAEWPGPDGLQRASRKVLHVPGSESREWSSVSYETY